MAWQSCLLTVFIVLMVLMLWLSYRPWNNTDAQRRDKRRRRRKCLHHRYHGDAEAYVSNHWSPRCSDARDPVVVMDDDDPDVPVASDTKASPSIAIAAPATTSPTSAA